MPKTHPDQKPTKIKPELIVSPKSNIVEQVPYIGFMLDELIYEQKMAIIPLIEKMEQVRQEMVQIKKEIVDRRDIGEYRYIEDVATTTETEFDFMSDFLFPIKSFMITNDGISIIQIGWTSIKAGITEISEERMVSILANETFPISNNVPVIWKFRLRTISGTSNYRLWFLW